MNNKESKRYLPGYRSLQMSVDKIARPLMGKVGRVQGMLLMHWDEIVGLDVAEAMAPVRVTHDSHRAEVTLHVNVVAERATILEYEVPQILEKINNFFGYQAVQVILLHQVTKI